MPIPDPEIHKIFQTAHYTYKHKKDAFIKEKRSLVEKAESI